MNPEPQDIDTSAWLKPEPQDSALLIETCTATTKAGNACKAPRLLGEETCIMHSPKGAEARAKGVQAAALSRTAKVKAREERVEGAKLTLTQRLAVRAAERQDELVEATLDRAILDRDVSALRLIWERLEGKVIDRLEHVAGDPFHMSDAELQAWLRQDETVTDTSMDTGIEGSGQAGGRTDSPDMPESP